MEISQRSNSRLAIFVILVLLGLLGNYLSPTLFFGIDFLFGSIFAMLALRLLGFTLGVLAGFVIALYTLYLWGHPYALIIFTLEIVAVGFWTQKLNNKDYMMADIFYWLVLGVPLVFLFYGNSLNLDTTVTQVIALKQSINAVWNTAFSIVIFIAFHKTKSIGSGVLFKKVLNDIRWSLSELLSTTVLLLALIPLLGLVIVDSKKSYSQLIEQQLIELGVISKVVDEHLQSVVAHDISEIEHLVHLYYEENRDKTIFKTFDGQAQALVLESNNKEQEIIQLAELGLVDTNKQNLFLNTLRQAETKLAYSTEGQFFYTTLHSDTPSFTLSIIYSPTSFQNVVTQARNLLDYKAESVILEYKNQFFLDDGFSHFTKFDREPISGREYFLSPKSIDVLSEIQRWEQGFLTTINDSSSFEGLKIHVAQPVTVISTSLQSSYRDILLIAMSLILTVALIAKMMTRKFDNVVSALAILLQQLASAGGSRNKRALSLANEPEELTQPVRSFNHLLASVDNEQKKLLALNSLYQLQAEKSQYEQEYTTKILDNLNDGVAVADRKGTIISVNQKLCTIFGYVREELIGKPSVILTHEKFRQKHQAGIEKYNRDGKKRLIDAGAVVSQGRRKDGTNIDVQITLTDIMHNGEPNFIAVIRDISQKIQAEKAIDSYKTEHDFLIDSSANPVFSIDSEGLITHWNGAIERLTGLKKQEILHTNIVSILPKTKSMSSPQTLIENSPKNIELNILTKTKKVVTILATASTQSYDHQTFTNFVGQDITELGKKIKEMAKESNQLSEELKAIFDLSPDGFLIINQHGKVVSFNPAFSKMTGLTETQVLGNTCESLKQFFFQNSEPNNRDNILKITKDRDIDDLHFSLNKPDLHTISLTSRCVRHNDKGFGTVWFLRDITEEEELGKMKSQFLSTAAHELRTPLASILGFSDLLLRNKYGEDEQKDLLEIINRQSALLKSLLNELLDLAKIESNTADFFKMESMELSSVIKTSVTDMSILAKEKSIGIDIHLESEGWDQVYGDKERLGQALNNIISNAIKYSSDDTTISIFTKSGKNNICICIKDQGMGMTKEVVRKVGQRFYRAESSGKISGTGLGMAIVKEIIKRHKGKISIDSVLGIGTTVKLYIPKDKSLINIVESKK